MPHERRLRVNKETYRVLCEDQMQGLQVPAGARAKETATTTTDHTEKCSETNDWSWLWFCVR